LFGYSLFDVAYYVADAGLRQLALIGNLPKSAHDWYNLLVQWNTLEHDHTIALCIAGCGIIFYGMALTVPVFYQTYDSADLNLKL
jgi:hypothetical protein